MVRKLKSFGWIRDLPDHRDLHLALTYSADPMPKIVDLRRACPPVYNQGNLGSCTANAAVFLVQYTEKEQTKTKRPVPSRLFHYYNTRVLQGTVNQDSGASIRNALKAFGSGYCNETLWPYMPMQFKDKPSKAAYDAARGHILGDMMYARIQQSEAAIKQSLLNNDPVTFGFTVYNSFMRVGKDGMIPLPGKSETVEGGHAIAIVGYDDAKKCFIIRNSWGAGWGASGYAYMPYDYILNQNLASDFWVVKQVPKVDMAQVYTMAHWDQTIGAA